MTRPYQSLCKEVDRQRVGIREELSEWPALSEGQCADVVAGSTRGDGIKLIECRCSQHIED